MKKSRIIFLSVTALVLIVGAYFFFTRNKTQSFSWKTSKIEKGNISVVVTSTGSINAVTTVAVGTQVTGTISKLFVDFNSVVKKGQVIAILDTTLYAAAKQDAVAALSKAKAGEDYTETEYNRMKNLIDKDAVSQSDFSLAKENYGLALADVQSAQAELNKAEINLKYTTITAPISGTVISRNVDVGQTVISSFNTPTLFSIANDLTKMQVQANVDEADIGQVKVGQKVSFTVDAYPDDLFEGLVDQIRLQPTVLQNVVNYIVIINVSNPDLKLMPGLTANINVKVNEHDNVLKVPMNALHFNPPAEYFTDASVSDSLKNVWNNILNSTTKKDANSFAIDTSSVGIIWIQKGKIIYPVKVKIGISDGTNVEVAGDIKEGDLVVTNINRDETATTSTTSSNPFMPKFPTHKK